MPSEEVIAHPGFKRCNACHELKPIADFYERRAQCKPCYLAKVRVWKDRWARRKAGEQIPYLTESMEYILPADLDSHFLAWLAGFVDGEGCFAILRKKNRSGTYNRQPMLVIAQSTAEVLYFIRDTLVCGGVFNTAGHSRPASELSKFQYQVSGQAALAVTRALLPYLRVKQDVASLFVTFKSAAGRVQVGSQLDEIRAEQEALAQLIHTLNAPDNRHWRPRPAGNLKPPTPLPTAHPTRA